MLHFYFILSLCIVASCNQDGEWFKCKPKPGCSIARCDPRPAGQWLGNDGLHNDYPILCQQNEASSSTTAVTELVNKFHEMRIDFAKLEGRLERSEKLEFDMNTEITLMEKKNTETESGLRNEKAKMKKEVEEGKTQLNGALKQITSLEKTNGEMRNEMDSVKKEAEEDIGKFSDAMKQIEKTNGEMRSEMDSVKKEAEEDKRKLNDAMKQIEKTNGEMRSEMDSVKKETEEDERKLNGAMRQIIYLKKTNIEMRNEMDKVKKEPEENKFKLNGAMKVICPVIYKNKCFIADLQHDVNYDDGVAVCKSRGGHLANIYSQTHMDDIMKYLRMEIRVEGSIWQEFRLGMKYDLKAKKLTRRDGTDPPAGLKWHPGTPSTVETHGAGYAGRTNVVLVVRSAQSSINQYLANIPPSYPRYVLCEIE